MKDKVKAPGKIARRLKLNRETVRRLPEKSLEEVAGGGHPNTHRDCSVPPWCPAHTC